MTTEALEPNRLLAEIGITEQQERAYRLLLARGGLDAHEVSTTLQLTLAQSLALLSALESQGLVRRVQDAELHFVPSTPEVAIEALILQRQAQLERTRSAIALLKREGEVPPRVPANDAIEVISGRTAILRAREMVCAAARSEVRCLLPVSLLGTSLQLPPEAARAPGVRHLHVVEITSIAGQLAFERLRAAASPTDECRSASLIPLGVIIADRQMALLPLEIHGSEEQALLMRSSALLEGLSTTFDMIWGQAAPPVEVARADASGAFSSELEALIPLLAAGLNDKAIAHRLRISVRTLIRRVAKLLSVLDARSRFQAGWATALRLHGISVPSTPHAPLAVPEAGSKAINGNHPLQRSAH